ncbi:acyl-CoA reductase [uncultured Alistipes sp.]|uniref:acyl-CoA reductase n=1 Tax=uncultured Alistipes sp. TaxID=538949 RepID=UPI00260E4B38|nr:acyl-CoA reductase [uncultured Alistipes sp.]
MKHAIELFSELGRRLERFGEDADSREVIARACGANGWFTPAEVRRAARALVTEMLTEERLRGWLAAYPLPVAQVLNVLVIMAGNIPFVGFFDLLCVVAAGDRCLVKPSAKDRVLMEYVVAQLLDIDPEARVALYDGTQPVDAVIATGSDNANRHFRAQYAGIPALLRGSRQSVAVLSGRETPEQLRGLADDIWAYSGLGCRSVSLLFLPKGYEPKLEMPDVNPKYINNYRQEKSLCEMTGTPFVDFGCAVAVEQRAFPAALSRIAYSRYGTTEEVAEWLAEHDDELQCVVTTLLPHSRRADFGRAQSPALTDWPDDRDVLEFLCGL